MQRVKCRELLLSANHRIVPTFDFVFLHVPAVLITGATTIAAAEVPLPCVDEHVSHQVPLELRNLSADLASVLLFPAAAERKEHLLNIFGFSGTKRSSCSPRNRQRWRRWKSGWTEALHHLGEGKC